MAASIARDGIKTAGAQTVRTPFIARETLTIEAGAQLTRPWPVPADMQGDLSSVAFFLDADNADAIGWLALQVTQVAGDAPTPAPPAAPPAQQTPAAADPSAAGASCCRASCCRIAFCRPLTAVVKTITSEPPNAARWGALLRYQDCRAGLQGLAQQLRQPIPVLRLMQGPQAYSSELRNRRLQRRP